MLKLSNLGGVPPRSLRILCAVQTIPEESNPPLSSAAMGPALRNRLATASKNNSRKCSPYSRSSR